jgi:23S rRNA (uracil1939-C5)-methyltransferase
VVDVITIDHVGHRGDGVAYVEGEAIYVPYTLPGERVEVEAVHGHPDRRRLLAVEQPSPQRIAPFCKHFGICGGCAIQHWKPSAYQAWKRDTVIETLRQAGIECDVAPLIDAHGAGRRRITLHARQGTHDVLKVGFTAAGSHDIVPIDQCPILDPALNGAIDAAWALAEALIAVGKPLDIQVTAADNGLDVDVRGSGPLPAKLIGVLSAIAEQHRLARLTRHGELVLMRTPPVLAIGAAQLVLPAGGFLQATKAGEDALAALVFTHCKGAKVIADLFCGVGPFALRLAEKFKVFAYDSDAGAIGALQKAITATSGLKPLKAELRDLFARPLVPQELREFDAAVFDPPRQGAQAQAQKLAASKIDRVIAVSCNPATFARDAKILLDGGFALDSVTPVDQFRHSPHVELVATFRR